MCYKIGSVSAVRNVASARICGTKGRERLDKLEKEAGSDRSLILKQARNWNRATHHHKKFKIF